MRGLDIWKTEREKAEVVGHVKVLRCLGGVDNNMPRVRIWVGKAIKPRDSYLFKTEAEREAFIDRKVKEYNDSIDARKAQIKASKEASRGTDEQVRAVFEGAIFHYSWGYDQTNCDFYQVVARRGRMVYLRKIASTSVEGSGGFMSDNRLPVKDNFTTETVIKKKLYFYNNTPHVSMNFGCCGLWDGKAQYCSWYA